MGERDCVQAVPFFRPCAGEKGAGGIRPQSGEERERRCRQQDQTAERGKRSGVAAGGKVGCRRQGERVAAVERRAAAGLDRRARQKEWRCRGRESALQAAGEQKG